MVQSNTTEKKYYINVDTISADGQDIKGYSTAEYMVSDLNSLNLGAMNIKTSYDSNILQTQSTTLTRSDGKYTGYLKALDGNVNTSWADYVDWYVEISDTNDADADGVPDFTDPVESSQNSTSVSVDLSGWSWHKWPWVYSDTLKNWLFYPTNAVWSNMHNKWFIWNSTTEDWVQSE